MWTQTLPTRATPLRPSRRSPRTSRRVVVGLGLVLALAITSGCGADRTPETTAAATGTATATTAAATPSDATSSPAATAPSVTPTAAPPATATSTPAPKPVTTPQVTQPPKAKAPARLGPMSLSAPSINVRGSLRRTSAVNGVVNPPSGVLAWITGYGRVRPGEVGTAVVAGHVVNGRRADIFYRLQDIDRGDKVTVYDSDGRPVVYTVTATRVATKSAVSRDAVVWGRNSSVRRLALITCDDDDGFRADGHRVANFVAIAEAR